MYVAKHDCRKRERGMLHPCLMPSPGFLDEKFDTSLILIAATGPARSSSLDSVQDNITKEGTAFRLHPLTEKATHTCPKKSDYLACERLARDREASHKELELVCIFLYVYVFCFTNS